MQHVPSPRLCFHVNQDCNLILFFTSIPPARQPTYRAGESIENSSFDLKGRPS